MPTPGAAKRSSHARAPGTVEDNLEEFFFHSGDRASLEGVFRSIARRVS